ncbi:hypothetical protein [Carboxylicivirga linearis]|uniref:Uncharacterized protein n=1 Tax=Carboxylicivirga linearis TaxID=1628157 RepID=A0ABS5JRZ8_9BACT|nr:hypothetical protein [Carboxylicivirga linearis]MBS2097587.1 hypothetical protein [Carboxylicivirga linearis]
MKNSWHSYQIIKKYNIIIRYFSKSIGIKDIYANISNSLSDPDYNSDLKVIFDFRDAVFSIDMDAIKKFADNIRKHPSLQEKRVIVFLTHTPNQVVFSNILHSFQQYQRFQIHVLSTMEATLLHLGLENSLITEMEDTIAKMKHNCISSSTTRKR